MSCLLTANSVIKLEHLIKTQTAGLYQLPPSTRSNLENWTDLMAYWGILLCNGAAPHIRVLRGADADGSSSPSRDFTWSGLNLEEVEGEEEEEEE